jgi:hypothetical protein
LIEKYGAEAAAEIARLTRKNEELIAQVRKLKVQRNEARAALAALEHADVLGDLARVLGYGKGVPDRISGA